MITFINTDIKAGFQEMFRQASADTLMGKATQPYDDGRHAQHRLQQPLL
jgi:hypothetical protein